MRVRDEQQEFGNPGRGVMLVSLPLSLQTKCQHPPEPFLFQAGTVASTLPRLPPFFFFFLACDSNSLNSLSFGVFRYSLLLPSNERNDYFLKPPKDAAPSLERLLTSKAHLSWGPSSLPPGALGPRATGSGLSSLSSPRSSDAPQRLCLSYFVLSPLSPVLRAASLKITVESLAS